MSRKEVARSMEDARRAATTEKAFIVRDVVSDRQKLRTLAREKEELERQLQAVQNRLEAKDAAGPNFAAFAAFRGWTNLAKAVLRRNKHRRHLV